jgi:RNA polymerase sigma-70 factor (sigma-E family)
VAGGASGGTAALQRGTSVPPDTDRPVEYDAFVSTRYPGLVKLAGHLLQDRHHAEDVVQEVFGRAFAKWRTIGGLDNPDAYVRTMVVNQCMSWFRRRSRREAARDPALMPERSATHGAAGRADRDQLLRLLGELSAQQRAVLVLRHYEDLPDSEIARLLRIREVTVRSHAMHGLNRLRVLLAAETRDAG